MTTPDSGKTPNTATTAPSKAVKMPVERRLKLVAAVTALVFLPSIVMLLITWAGTGKPQGAATWASIPAIVGIAAA